jgi:dipeptidyl aminopeptidase/acylaminoacyl peptidase
VWWPLAIIWPTLFFPAAPALGQDPPEPGAQLTVPFIMRGPELVGTAPSRIRWSPDGESLYFIWKPPGETREGLYQVGRSGGAAKRLGDGEGRRAEARLRPAYSHDRRLAAYADAGDLYLLDIAADRERLLISTQGHLSDVQIAPNGRAVYFVHQDNLFRIDVASGAAVQLSDIRRGRAPPEPEPAAGQRQFLAEEQRRLIRALAEDSLRRAADWPPPDSTTAVPEPFYLAEGEYLGDCRVAPDGRQVAFSLYREAREARLAWVPDYVTEDGYTREAPYKRSYVGDAQGSSRLGIMELETGAVTWADAGQGERPVDLIFRGWSERGGAFLAIGMAEDMHDRWILLVDAATGASKVLDQQHDDAWVSGAAAGGWLPDGDRVWYISEASGYTHLYTIAVGGGEPRPLTTGPWEVLRAELSPDEREWFLVTNEVGPHERGFYRMDLDGRNRRLITTYGTLHGEYPSVAVAPDGRRLAALYSRTNRPPELFLQDNRPGAAPLQVTESGTAEFRAREWLEPEIVYFSARDGADVPARLYRPERANGAAVVFVHGAGYLQNVHRWWSSYYREYMFHNLLVERGYTVLDVDYRGSAGYGRDWRVAVYKRMGGPDLSDLVDGARFLVDSLAIDARRIGIYGGSYGGFLTLMAMFTQPGVFAAGAALRPVTDWAYYAHGWTSRILGVPQDDPEAYRASSPIYHVEGLAGALLICHGMIDQNVHFQDTVRLVERLLELGKENWEVAIYPKEDHDFAHAWAWADEYRRILELFEENLSPRP